MTYAKAWVLLYYGEAHEIFESRTESDAAIRRLNANGIIGGLIGKASRYDAEVWVEWWNYERPKRMRAMGHLF